MTAWKHEANFLDVTLKILNSDGRFISERGGKIYGLKCMT